MTFKQAFVVVWQKTAFPQIKFARDYAALISTLGYTDAQQLSSLTKLIGLVCDNPDQSIVGIIDDLNATELDAVKTIARAWVGELFDDEISRAENEKAALLGDME
mgnify:CR=1 FL=1